MLLDIPSVFVKVVFNYISHLIALTFSLLMITWYLTFACATTRQKYIEVLSMVFLTGWLFTISLTKGIKELHTYTIMLKYIIFKNITRFLLIYIFVLVGCGLSFHSLFLLRFHGNVSAWPICPRN